MAPTGEIMRAVEAQVAALVRRGMDRARAERVVLEGIRRETRRLLDEARS